jgi:hypothetical protein
MSDDAITWPLTLRFPADYPGPLIREQYRRLWSGELEAWFYEREELEWCVAVGKAIKESQTDDG